MALARRRLNEQFKAAFAPSNGLVIQDRKLGDQHLESCFVGNELIDVICRTQRCTRRDAASIAQTFVDKVRAFLLFFFLVCPSSDAPASRVS